VSRPTRHRRLRPFVYRAITFYGRTFQTVPLERKRLYGLVRVRSPLLTESRLISFPPGTEMFQFSGLASATYVFSCGYPASGVGFPIRKPSDQSSFASSPKLSWATTSFIACCRLGIHHVRLFA
jgi:hypothetical protein